MLETRIRSHGGRRDRERVDQRVVTEVPARTRPEHVDGRAHTFRVGCVLWSRYAGSRNRIASVIRTAATQRRDVVHAHDAGALHDADDHRASDPSSRSVRSRSSTSPMKSLFETATRVG